MGLNSGVAWEFRITSGSGVLVHRDDAVKMNKMAGYWDSVLSNASLIPNRLTEELRTASAMAQTMDVVCWFIDIAQSR